MPDGGRSAAWGLRYQYLRTLEALMDAAEDPACGVVAVHVEGVPDRDGMPAESVDFELTDAGGHTVLAAQVKARTAGTELGAGQVFRTLSELVHARDAARYKLIANARAGNPPRL